MKKIQFKNKPDTTTPVNADNLNLLQENVEEEFNTLNNKFNDFILGNLTGVNGVTISISSYILYKNLLILVADLVATQDVAQYAQIASLSNGALGIPANAYLYDVDGKRCYLDKRYGSIYIYQSGGLANGAMVRFTGVYILNS